MDNFFEKNTLITQTESEIKKIEKLIELTNVECIIYKQQLAFLKLQLKGLYVDTTRN